MPQIQENQKGDYDTMKRIEQVKYHTRGFDIVIPIKLVQQDEIDKRKITHSLLKVYSNPSIPFCMMSFDWTRSLICLFHLYIIPMVMEKYDLKAEFDIFHF